MLLRADQQGGTGETQTPVDSDASIGAMERANRTLRELLRTTQHATETKIGGRLDTDHPLISWMVRHCCSMCDQMVGGLTKGFETTAKEAGLLVLEKSFGQEFQERSCCAASSKWIGLSWRTLTSTCVTMSTGCASSEPSGGSLRHPDGEGEMSTSLLATLPIPSQRDRLGGAEPALDLQMECATTIRSDRKHRGGIHGTGTRGRNLEAMVRD